MTTTNIYDMAQAWNNGAVDFTAIKMNVTDTASGSGSLLFDLQVGGSSKAKITKAGNQTLAGTLVTGGNITIPVGSNLISTSAHVKLNANNVVVTYGGRYATFSGTLLDVSGGGSQGVRASYFRLGYTTDAYVYGDADNAIGMRNGTNAQSLHIYNTYTDASNYERASIFFDANQAILEAGYAGTGVARSFYLRTGGFNRWGVNSSGAFFAVVNRGYDLGLSGNRVRTLFTTQMDCERYITLTEFASPTTPSANSCSVYAKDNGAGKTQLVVRMPDGVETVLATET